MKKPITHTAGEIAVALLLPMLSFLVAVSG
jgi:hypothetical protein